MSQLLGLGSGFTLGSDTEGNTKVVLAAGKQNYLIFFPALGRVDGSEKENRAKFLKNPIMNIFKVFAELK